jgi:hypothetical protein
MLTVKAWMVHLQCIFLTETCDNNAEAAENGHIFQFMSVFQRSVTHSKVARASCCNQGLLFVCAISAFKRALFYKILWKSRVFLDFFFSSLHYFNWIPLLFKCISFFLLVLHYIIGCAVIAIFEKPVERITEHWWYDIALLVLISNS